MSKVLIVDDECRYREELQLALSRDGHEIRLAADGREAIAVGTSFRPDVLVADWMLPDRIHGLHVSKVLKTVYPDVQTVLITGYASADLRLEADRCDISVFIEKPFRLSNIQDAVRQAAQTKKESSSALPIGIVEVDGLGNVLYANRVARDMFSRSKGDAEIRELADVQDVDSFFEWESAAATKGFSRRTSRWNNEWP